MRVTRSFLVVLACVLVAGCGGRKLIPSPNLYVQSEADPYAGVPEHFQNTEVDVLYVTDRRPVPQDDGTLEYDHGRSYSMAYGSAVLRIGDEDTTWEQLSAASRTDDRDGSFPVSVVRVEERARFPKTPFPLIEAPQEDTHDHLIHDPEVVAQYEETAESLRNEVRRRLALTPRKHAYVFVHGYNNSFEHAVSIAGEVWHFMPRMGVPIAYTWPAGQGGLRGYFYDRESGEFTIFHLKDFLRILASVEELEKIHIVAHSRGTDVILTAIRELWLEIREKFRGTGKRATKKLSQVIVAAPDLDIDVIQQRIGAEEVVRELKHITVYMSKSDAAIGFSTWLFVSQNRIGRITAEDLQGDLISKERTQSQKNISLIDARIDSGFIGHSYFYSHPAVLSDVILILGDERLPGEEHGRPLETTGGILWTIDDDYPAK